jgi:hypothetical protein
VVIGGGSTEHVDHGTGCAGPQGRPARERAVKKPRSKVPRAPSVTTEAMPSQVGNGYVPPPPTIADENAGAVESGPRAAAPEPESSAPAPTVSATAPPEVQEFAVDAAAASPPSQSAPAGGTSGGSAETSAVRQEFGP